MSVLGVWGMAMIACVIVFVIGLVIIKLFGLLD